MHQMQHEAMHRLGIEEHDDAPPIENFAEPADKRVRLGLLIRQLIADNDLKLDEDRVRAHVEEMCAGYENAEDMVNMYLSNAQAMQQIEPMVLEQTAVEWLIEQGQVKDRKVSFTDYMNEQ